MTDKKSLATAADVTVSILDGRAKVPGTDLWPFEYREKVDANWQPGPDFPKIQPAPLPERRGNLARAAAESVFRTATRARQPGEYDALPTKNPIVQAVSHSDSLDLRYWRTTRWDNKAQKEVPIPVEEHRPLGSPTSLFLNTVHACFARHFPLGIRPDGLMWMVLHEVGVTVKLHPEAYRHLFTDSPDKKLIDVQVQGLEIDNFDQADIWAQGIERLCTGLQEAMPPGLLPHLLPPLSTHDLGSRTASVVAVLDAASPYYDYLMRTCCGIPRIRLFGTGADYDGIVTACGQLAEVFHAHLGRYFAELLPVLKEIADTANGRKAHDNGFWSSIYKHYSGSGTDDMDGWITAFLNYELHGASYKPKAEERYDWRASLANNEKASWSTGIHRDHIPNHLSSVPFVWNYAKNHGGNATAANPFAGTNLKAANGGNGICFDCRLVGGFMAVEDVDGFATPTLGYAVLRGDELAVTVNEDKSWTVQSEGHTPITAQKRTVYGAADGRIEVYAQPAPKRA